MPATGSVAGVKLQSPDTPGRFGKPHNEQQSRPLHAGLILCCSHKIPQMVYVSYQKKNRYMGIFAPLSAAIAANTAAREALAPTRDTRLTETEAARNVASAKEVAQVAAERVVGGRPGVGEDAAAAEGAEGARRTESAFGARPAGAPDGGAAEKGSVAEEDWGGLQEGGVARRSPRGLWADECDAALPTSNGGGSAAEGTSAAGVYERPSGRWVRSFALGFVFPSHNDNLHRSVKCRA